MDVTRRYINLNCILFQRSLNCRETVRCNCSSKIFKSSWNFTQIQSITDTSKLGMKLSSRYNKISGSVIHGSISGRKAESFLTATKRRWFLLTTVFSFQGLVTILAFPLIAAAASQCTNNTLEQLHYPTFLFDFQCPAVLLLETLEHVLKNVCHHVCNPTQAVDVLPYTSCWSMFNSVVDILHG